MRFAFNLVCAWALGFHSWSQAEIRSVPLHAGIETGKFQALDAEKTGIDLVYQFPEDAPFALMTDQYSGNGVCVGDMDGDGLPDVYLTHYDRGNRLYRNLGDWKFQDVTDTADVSGKGAWCAGSSFADVDNDGDLDLFVCVFDGPNLLYLNDGKGVFVESAAAFGLDYLGPSVMMAFADYDLDGDLDGYLVTHRMPLGDEAKPPRNSKEAFDRGIVEAKVVNGKRQATIAPRYRDLFAIMSKGEGRIELITAGREDILYQNNGAGKFINVSRPAGIAGRDIGLAATWWDANADGYPDLYVSNDYKGPDHLYLNQKNGTFRDVSQTALPHIPWLSMGSDFSDINRDGHMDFMATDMAATTHYQQKVSMGDMEKDQWFLNLSNPRQMMRNAVYLNTGTPRFAEAAFLTGLASSDWTWSLKFGDLDNDGWEDLFITNGMSRDFMNSDLAAKMPSRWRSDQWADTPVLRQKNLAFQNLGDLSFKDRSAAWGLDTLRASYGAAFGDLDRDGDLDLIVANFSDPVSILRNDINAKNRLTIALRGSGKVNRFGVGAEVSVKSGSGRQVKQLALARGFMSANEALLHFGLGDDSSVEHLEVRWPGGGVRSYQNITANQHLILTLDADADTEKQAPSAAENRDTLGIPKYKRVQFPEMPAAHRENPFDDYARQPLLPMKHSQLGPGLAVGDVNGDGNDDFYIGGAAGQSGQLVIVASTMKVHTAPFAPHADREDMGALFFDADGDRDLDLYVVSGGVACGESSPLLGDRLYLNDGKGTFSDASKRLPKRLESGSTVAAADVDRDGDLDLFVGSRLIPGRYPEAAASQWLINEGGTFSDRGSELSAGLVTSALWTDLNGDGWQDLLIAEDWGPVRCWVNAKGSLRERTLESGLNEYRGWWNGLASRDLDGDGDMDFVASNLGLNSKYKASTERPLHLYYGDFDRSGRKYLVEAGYELDTLYPKRGRSCSSRAMPGLGDRFKTFHAFASASLAEIYGEDLTDAIDKTATTLESGAFINDGKGRFAFRPFPRLAQISQGFGITLTEVNGDAFPDVFMVHNNFHPQPETGRFDSGLSQLLLGKGDGTFVAAPHDESHLLVPGDARALVQMDWNRDGAHDFLISQNDGTLLAFQNSSPLGSIRLHGEQVIGARVEVTAGQGPTQVAEVQAGGGYLAQQSATLAFGTLGEEDAQAMVMIRWPDGTESRETISWATKRIWTFNAPRS